MAIKRATFIPCIILVRRMLFLTAFTSCLQEKFSIWNLIPIRYAINIGILIANARNNNGIQIVSIIIQMFLVINR